MFDAILKWQIFRGRSADWRSLGVTVPLDALVRHGRMGSTISTFVQHNQVVSNYFRCEFLVPLFIFPASRPEAAFNVHQAALMKIFLCQFSQSTPKHDCVPFRL